MKKKLFLLVLTATVIALTAIAGEPQLIKKVPVTATFEKIYVQGNMKLVLVQTADYIMISGDEKNVNSTSVVIRNGKLKLKAGAGQTTVYVPVSSTRSLEVDGDAEISSDVTINVPKFALILNGTVNATLKTTGHIDISTGDGCEIILLKKEKFKNDVKAAEQPSSFINLLTSQQWVLASYGDDADNNGIIDDTEEQVLDCEKDNTYNFKANGSGIWTDNNICCGNGLTEQPFVWELTQNGSGIDFVFGDNKLLSLNANELVLYQMHTGADGNPVKYMMTFRH